MIGKTYKQLMDDTVADYAQHFVNNSANDPMLQAALACEWALTKTSEAEWAARWVDLRMAFHSVFSRGLICSTLHGTEFFSTVARCCQGTAAWKEQGPYEDNFRKMIRDRTLL